MASVPRPIQYDRERVLEGVMQTFWEKGYEGASISDLVKATGLNTRTMYNLFGDKQGIYLAALENYRLKYMREHLAVLRSQRGIGGIRKFFERLVKTEAGNSCLLSNSLSEESGAIGGRCREFAYAYFSRLEVELEKNLEEASQDGEFKGDKKTTAQALVCFLQGLGLYSKLHPAPNDRRRLVDRVIGALAA
jgi:TetR/AcrR family transcriptional repressor of nem operon